MKLFYMLLIIIARIYTLRAEDFEQHDPHLLYYEPIYYDREYLHHQQQKSHQTDNTMLINFQAFNRNFTLSLKTSNVPYESSLRRRRDGLDKSFIYSGTDIEYPGSSVRISIINGTFRGSIKHSGEVIYHVVPSHQFFTGLPPFHTVIYKESDYNWTHTFLIDSFDSDQNSYQESQLKDQLDFIQEQERLRRAVPDEENWFLKKRLCPTKLSTDITLWNFFIERYEDEDVAYLEITNMLDEIIHGSNEIFEATTFNVNGHDIDGIRLIVKEIQICETRMCPDDPCCHYEYENVGGYKGLLDVFNYYEGPSIDEYTDFFDNDNGENDLCLSMLVTAQTIYKTTLDNKMSPILGYTNHAEAPDFTSGICSKENTGYMTILRDTTTSAMPGHILQMLFAHEAAHAFGAYHDNTKDCDVYNLMTEPDEGYYLMHSIIQSGSKRNNKRFSNCSRYHMSKTLQLNKNISKCFIEGESICGNGIVDPGEECDCGMRCDKDLCCHPHNATVENRCTLKQHAQCSPSQGPCCNISTCSYISSTEDYVCKHSQECVDTLYCKGEIYGAVCPKPEHHQIRSDGFICNENGRVCERGSCNASVCKLIGWTECSVTNDKDKLSLDDREDLCYMACKEPGTNECINTHDEERLNHYPELKTLLYNVSLDQRTSHLPIKLPVGTLCNNNLGYCDVFRRCRGADPDTPLVRLKNCVTSGECVKYIENFVREHWWLVLLCAVAAIILFFLVVPALAKHTKSSNPDLEEKHPHLTLRQTSVTLRKNAANLRNSMRDSFRRRSRGMSKDPDPHRVGVSDVEMALIIEGKSDEAFASKPSEMSF